MRSPAVRLVLVAAGLAGARFAAGTAADPAGLWSRSLAAYNAHDHAAALASVRALLAEDPDNPLYRRHEAAVLFDAGDYPAAAASAERFFRSAPEPVQACPLLPNCYRKMRDGARALDALRRCLAVDPRSAEAAFNLAQGLEETGRLTEAADLYARLARDGWLGAVISLGRVRLAQGRAAEAEAAARSALAREPANAAAFILAGQAATARGEPKRALADLEAARRLAPLHPEVWRALARARAASGDETGAAAAEAELGRLTEAR